LDSELGRVGLRVGLRVGQSWAQSWTQSWAQSWTQSWAELDSELGRVGLRVGGLRVGQSWTQSWAELGSELGRVGQSWASLEASCEEFRRAAQSYGGSLSLTTTTADVPVPKFSVIGTPVPGKRRVVPTPKIVAVKAQKEAPKDDAMVTPQLPRLR
jgi:hypothetical protein